MLKNTMRLSAWEMLTRTALKSAVTSQDSCQEAQTTGIHTTAESPAVTRAMDAWPALILSTSDVEKTTPTSASILSLCAMTIQTATMMWTKTLNCAEMPIQ